jgi:uncharacterized protein (TIGR03083 family)
MNQKRPVIVVDLFAEERQRLLDLLGSLAPEQWSLATSCPGWSVKDIAAHVLGDDLNNLSGGRDGLRTPGFRAAGTKSWHSSIGATRPNAALRFEPAGPYRAAGVQRRQNARLLPGFRP